MLGGGRLTSHNNRVFLEEKRRGTDGTGMELAN